MKKLHIYVSDYFVDLYKNRTPMREEVYESIEYKAIISFIDYIWKNPK